MSQWTDFAVFGIASTGIGWLLISVAQCLRRRVHPPPACWMVTVTDADGVPVKSVSVSAKGVARLITALNTNRFA